MLLNKIKGKLFDRIKSINDSYEFKPLLTEIEESPVCPLGRFTFWTVTLLILITLLWVSIAQIDIVVNARGIVIPDGEAKTIQSLETGSVKQILVKEGDFVRKGQLLIEIDSSITNAKLQTINKNLEQTKLEAERLKSNGIGMAFNEKSNHQNISKELDIQRQLYQENTISINSAVQAKRQEILQLKNQINAVEAQRRDYQLQLSNAKAREQRLKNVLDVIAYNDYLDAQNKSNTLQEAIFRLDADIRRLKSQQFQIQNEITQMISDFRSQNLSMLANMQKSINELEANKEEIEFAYRNQKIIAPCDGYIDKLLIHTIGGVVTPAQELILLTPVEQPLIIKAQVINRDIGFIKVGMPVALKVDTFDFQKYGILHGTVKSISKNSINDSKLGAVYEVYIIPKESKLLVEGIEQSISTGMTLNAEIEIGRRRIIEFFIYPLIKYLDEGISVR